MLFGELELIFAPAEFGGFSGEGLALGSYPLFFFLHGVLALGDSLGERDLGVAQQLRGGIPLCDVFPIVGVLHFLNLDQCFDNFVRCLAQLRDICAC